MDNQCQSTQVPEQASNGASSANGASAAPERVLLETLLGSRRELVIVHNGRDYRLRLTQNDKLILTA